jgi:hypothetical protein
MRDKHIDLLRFIGLSLIILAHVDPPGWLLQLRNFDVPLIVLAGGMAFNQTGLSESYPNYVWKRIKRLVFPAWLFLTLYFFVIGHMGFKLPILTAKNFWTYYTFSNGSGFFWIIRIFVLVALSAPLMFIIDRRIKSNRAYLIMLLAAYLLYEGLLYILNLQSETVWIDLIISIFCYAIAYSLIYALGMRLNRLTATELLSVGALSFVIFAAFGFTYYFQNHHFVSTQTAKYPPSVYYLAYALAASILMWHAAKWIYKFVSQDNRLEAVIMFIAQNSLWIYFWHTFFLLFTYRMSSQNFVVKYLFVYSLAVILAYVQIMLVQKFILPFISNNLLRKDIKMILTG